MFEIEVPVPTFNELCRRFNVARQTLNNWRRPGGPLHEVAGLPERAPKPAAEKWPTLPVQAISAPTRPDAPAYARKRPAGPAAAPYSRPRPDAEGAESVQVRSGIDPAKRAAMLASFQRQGVIDSSGQPKTYSHRPTLPASTPGYVPGGSAWDLPEDQRGRG
jgi:hypothetical protein